MATQDVIDRVNEEELRGTVAIVGEETADHWLKYLKAKGMKTLSRLLNHEGGAMKTAGTDEVKAAKKWSGLMVSDSDEKKKAGNKLAGLDAGEREAQLLDILASARIRLPESVKRMQAAVGLKSDKQSQALPMDEGGLWKGLQKQRCMRPLPNHLRGSTKLLRELWDALTDVSGRYLPTVELDKVLAVSEIRNPGGEKEEQKDGEKKKDGGTPHGRRRRVTLVMRSLAACCSRSISGTPLQYTGTQGASRVNGQDLRLDATLQECEETGTEICDLMDGRASYAAGSQVWATFWARLQREVSAAGSQNRSVAAGLEEALHEALRMQEGGPTAAGKKPPGERSAKSLKRERTRERKKAAAAATAEPSTPPTAKKQKKSKANTSGQVCSDFLNGKCRYGAACIHRHPKDTDDPDGADVRE